MGESNLGKSQKAAERFLLIRHEEYNEEQHRAGVSQGHLGTVNLGTLLKKANSKQEVTISVYEWDFRWNGR